MRICRFVFLAVSAALLYGIDGYCQEEVPVVERMLPEEVVHLRFMGMPIDGSPLPCIEALKEKGFQFVDKTPNMFFLKGRFSGQDDCHVVLTTKEDFVWKVSVSFPSQQTWSAIRNQYDRYKQSYIDKYGVRPQCIEKLSPRFREGSGQEHWGFEDESSQWESIFDMREGFIVLSVRFNKSESQLFLFVEYVDRVNYLLKEQIDMEDI